MSTTSLYTTTTSPNVTSNNFTTLYTGVQTVSVNTGYGNANVEAFLNVGSDGSNTVQNIVMTGNLNVGGQSNLGNVGNVHITGGTLNYLLQTDGNGNLQWAPYPNLHSNITPYTHFDVVSNGNNQNFTNTNLSNYVSNGNLMSVFKNGVNIEPTQYTIAGSTLTINVPLSTGDTIDVLPNGGSGSGSEPGGATTQVQYNGGNILSGNSSFTFDQANSKLTVGNIVTGTINLSGNLSVAGVSNLGSNSNVHITGGVSGQILRTDGLGNLSWVYQSSGGGNVAGSNTQVQFNNNGNFGASSNLTFNITTNTLTVPNIIGNISNANYANLAGSSITSISANTAGNSTYANSANFANYSNFAGNAYSVTGANVVGYVSDSNHAIISDSSNSVNAANVVGNVNYANYANFAGTAYSINGGNVSGSVNTANYSNYAGTVLTNSQPNITSVGTLSSLTVSGNITAGNINGGNLVSANYFSGTLLGGIANANYSNFAGNAFSVTGSNVTGQVANALIAGTVYTNSQPNITSVGTLSSVTVSGTGNIANTVLTKYNETVINGGSVSGTILPNASAGTIYQYTLTGNISLNSIANAVAGTSMTIELTQDATGGRTLSSTMKFAGGLKTLSTNGNAVDIITLYYNGTTYYAVLSKGYA